jgi:GNAT superfamily N-acetyltransferase
VISLTIDKLKIVKAEIMDLPSILSLQKLAYHSEAVLVNDFSITPLTQTLEGITADLHAGTILKAVAERDPNVIIGSVRGRVQDDTLYVARLMVDPALQNRGTGRALLSHIESLYPQMRYELYTSDRSEKNLSLYINNGYKEFKREPLSDEVSFVFLEKY